MSHQRNNFRIAGLTAVACIATSCQPTLKCRDEVNKKCSQLMIVDEDFLWNSVDNDLNIQKISSLYPEPEVKHVSFYNSTEKNKVITFKSGGDEFYFVELDNTTDLYTMELHSGKITLNDEIKVGMLKNDFKRIFNLWSMPDNVIIGDEEGVNYFSFTFKNHELKQISFERYLD